jgi:hypothetical protein
MNVNLESSNTIGNKTRRNSAASTGLSGIGISVKAVGGIDLENRKRQFY